MRDSMLSETEIKSIVKPENFDFEPAGWKIVDILIRCNSAKILDCSSIIDPDLNIAKLTRTTWLIYYCGCHNVSINVLLSFGNLHGQASSLQFFLCIEINNLHSTHQSWIEVKRGFWGMFIGDSNWQLTSTEKKTKVSLSEGVLLAACIKYRKIKDETQRIVSIQNAKGSLFLNLPKTSKSLLFPAQFPILPRCRPEVIMQF